MRSDEMMMSNQKIISSLCLFCLVYLASNLCVSLCVFMFVRELGFKWEFFILDSQSDLASDACKLQFAASERATD